MALYRFGTEGVIRADFNNIQAIDQGQLTVRDALSYGLPKEYSRVMWTANTQVESMETVIRFNHP